MRLLFIYFFVFPFYSFSQEPLISSEVIEVSDIDKNELFIRGREWFSDNFKIAKDVLLITDKESGELSGKGVMRVNYVFKYLGERKFTTDVKFQMSIWAKEGKYKYELTNFYIVGEEGNIEFGLITTLNETNVTASGFNEKKLNEMYLSIKNEVESKAKLLIDDLKIKMLQKSKSSDW